MKKYDLIVIGAGPGGYEAAARAAQAGLKTLLIEKQHLGGTCLNTGCIPVKTLLASVHFLQKIKKASLFNIKVEKAELDFAALIERKDRLTKRLQKGIEIFLKDSGVETVFGEAKLLPEKIVEVNEEKYTAQNIILATGGVPGTLPGLVPDGKWLITNEQLLNNETLPAKLVIIGAGVIGLEFADIYSRLGVKVTLIDIIDQLLPAEDREAVELMQKSLQRAGCDFILGSRIEKITDKTIYLAAGQTITADICLLAAGRKIITDYIQDSALQKTSSGALLVDENFQTSVSGIYAVGDINNLALYAHAAVSQGLSVVEKILTPSALCATSPCKGEKTIEVIPKVIFTSPQIASIGRYTDKVKKNPVSLLGKAQTENQTEGFLKLFLDEQEIIVGCVIVSENADALIGEAAVLVNSKTNYTDLKKMVHPHPTWSEIFAL